MGSCGELIKLINRRLIDRHSRIIVSLRFNFMAQIIPPHRRRYRSKQAAAYPVVARRIFACSFARA
ncbi:hypothetical protein BRADI_4g42565v3 [Brachypodium distachyon]|uniref:Uncharacterized protein n=1 Tax=Brachypodium distachyon TaxID=15368 RepID=A0A2K2CTV3_BRADI|nr:hypothetical protein BRADI_4g42565v3 [Brachypodium distachyon]